MLIIASVGLNLTEDRVRKIILAGADVLRYNLSYYSLEKNLEYIENTRGIIDGLNSSIKELIDFPLSKIRLGDFDLKVFAVQENEELVFQSAPYSPDCNQFIPVNTQKIGENVHLNQTISLGDGQICVQVTDILGPDAIKVKVLNNGVIQYMKTFNLGYRVNDDVILATYKTVLKTIPTLKPDYIALSYINSDLTEEIKKMDSFSILRPKTKNILKIEKSITDAELEMICQDPFFDLILIDRGEMGVNMPFEKVGTTQKKIFAVAKKYGKKVIVSTQILEGSVNNFIPAKSDILDLTNLILDGAYGIVLCTETGLSERPAYMISSAKKIIEEANNFKKKNENPIQIKYEN